MERSMNMHTPSERAREDTRAVASAAWHGLLWLAVANGVGVLIAILLLAPWLNRQLGEWTYGRWMMVHMNLELYGWASLPLVGFLFRVYGADRGRTAQWCRPVFWVWSAALGVGAMSWLSGHSSGKLFLDWSGFARVLFPGALVVLWLLLTIALVGSWKSARGLALAAKVMGLAVLLAVPFLIYSASGTSSYPPVNPDTGGPTGASQLESSLGIVAVVLLLPFGIARRLQGKTKIVAMGWIVLAAESALCVALGRADASHHDPMQFVSLGSLLVWLVLTPAYYAGFAWHENTRLWRVAMLWWWAALLVTGWIFFLPGVLDHFKFTDGLVGHSFVAMAGFASSLLIFAMVQLLGEGGWIFNRTRSFYLWHGSVLAYVVVVTAAGWREGFDPTFTIVPGVERNVLYALRLATGIAMLVAALDWLRDATALVHEPVAVRTEVTLEKTA